MCLILVVAVDGVGLDFTGYPKEYALKMAGNYEAFAAIIGVTDEGSFLPACMFICIKSHSRYHLFE